MAPLLQVKNLKTYFNTTDGLVKAVDGVSYYINEGEVVGLVGESGCGKSVSQLSVTQLITSPPGEIVGGEVIFEGQNLLEYKAESKQMRAVLGAKIAMVFQEPMTSLNPVLTICDQMTESLMLHLKMDYQTARRRAMELLKLVGIPEPEVRIDNYPHQFSGGMRQRVMIAIALSCNPRLIIADEPTTALDVTTQAQLMELMTGIVRERNTALVIVTHNLGVVARYAQRIYVMYAGHIVESGTSEDVFGNPSHPYTIGLLQSVPRLDESRGRQLVPIPGMPPDLIDMPAVCAFRRRCSFRDQCNDEGEPELREVSKNHFIRCFKNIKELSK
ncbi:MAG: ABC transporter ATP-binding protein [Dehalococcoidales bacterium]|nr:ABC transporter ATP-binding protein [Dehalococcoidales bacterium]